MKTKNTFFRAITGCHVLHDTPLVRLNSIVPATCAKVYVKLEKHNEPASVKTRIAEAMIIRAEELGILKPFSGQTILEASGSNTALGLAVNGIRKGYRTVFSIPDNYNKSRIASLRLFGSTVFLSDHTTGNDSHFVLARKLSLENKDWYYIDQLSNPANPGIHYARTGKEIVDALKQVDCFVSAIGSGGTITGAGRRIKESCHSAKIIGVQPVGCKTLEGKAIPHKIQGISIGTVPSILDRSIIDDMISVSYEQAMDTGLKLMQHEALFLGISANAAVTAAIRLAETLPASKTIVCIAPDGGEYYLQDYLDYKSTKSNI